MRARRTAVPALLAVLALLAAGCVGLPVSGPVVESQQQAGGTGPDAVVVPNPPQPGESPTEIVTHFLEAMRANPVQTSVARQFLSTGARSQWRPEESTIVYEDLTPARGTLEVRLRVVDAHWLDQRGSWVGPLPRRRASLRFPMVVEDGEWRIAEAPDALIVPRTWFEQRFRQVSLYFFDPSASILVPEPIFVPRGDQLATNLVRSLLQGPSAELTDVATSYIPSGTTLELSVPVSGDGTAEVSLSGDLDGLSARAVELMMVQLSWTLRQEPAIRSIRFALNGEPVTPPGSATEFRVDGGQQYAPTVAGAPDTLFGLLHGQVVEVTPGEDPLPRSATEGSSVPLRDLAVSLDGSRVAGVTRDGTRVRVAGTDEDSAAAVTVATGQDLLKPGWDFTGRLWLVDRNRGEAVVSHLSDGRRRQLRVPGITGRDVSRFLVSRDGSRLVAVVRRDGGDAVVVSRVRHDLRGRVLSASRASTVAHNAEDPLTVEAVGWASTTSVMLLNRFTEELSEVQVVPVDGSHSDVEQPFTALIREPVRGLAVSPAEGPWRYVVTAAGVVALVGGDRQPVRVREGITDLTYVG